VLFRGDCLEKLKDLEDNSIDSIVTDPPYGLSFMGKKWDYDVPSRAIWEECLRVLKPGGHLLAFGGTRTYHRLVVNIEDAGFEIRDQIQWLYGSGFPKSHNIKEGEFKGWGSALKPANEPICVARKPLEKGLTLAANVLKYGTGAINIDESRIGTEKIPQHQRDLSNAHGNNWAAGTKQPVTGVTNYTVGRWPANIILDEVAAEMLDEQSGILKSGGGDKHPKSKSTFMVSTDREQFKGTSNGGDSGGASRFFYVAKASKRERNAGLEGMPTKILATSTGQTRPNKPARLGANPHGIQEPVQNHHPTVKPIKLMEYLIRLVTPKGGTTLDPFMGSGSTGVAANNLGFNFIGIEMNPEYFEIASKRIITKETKKSSSKPKQMTFYELAK